MNGMNNGEKKMPKIRDIKITETMLQSAAMYDKGYSIDEICTRQNRSRDRVRLALVALGIEADERKYRPGTKTGKIFSKDWEETVAPLRKYFGGTK